MRIPFQQTTVSGCASYCLANLFNDERYLNGIQELNEGEGIMDINRKLDKYYPEIYADYLFVTNSKLKIHPNRLIETLVFEPLWETVDADKKERGAVPYLATVQMSKNHCVLIIHNLKDNLYYVFDSLIPDRFVLTAEVLLYHYRILTVQQLFFWNEPEEKNSVMIFKECFPHLFNPEE